MGEISWRFFHARKEDDSANKAEKALCLSGMSKDIG